MMKRSRGRGGGNRGGSNSGMYRVWLRQVHALAAWLVRRCRMQRYSLAERRIEHLRASHAAQGAYSRASATGACIT